MLSPRYLADNLVDFENVLAQTMGVQAGNYRLLPIVIETMDKSVLPTRIGMLSVLDLTHPYWGKQALERLVHTLPQPLPHRI